VSSGQLANLEAVISVIGRPAWFVRNNAPDVEDELDVADEAWLVHIGRQLAGIKRACARVAAIFKERGGQRTEIGTGWMIGTGLLATNAHVARHLFFPYFSAPANDPAGGWRPRPGVIGTADFRFERGGSADGPFAIGASCFIESDENSRPDLAVLAVRPRNGALPPTALELELDRAGNWDGRRIFAVGHPVADANDDANVAVVFGELDGTKRISPGEARGLLGDFVLAHDCATVNGSSGSPILDFGTAKVVGLHYWGEPGARNESIFLPAIHDHPAIVKSLAAGFGG
jgi:S1-C subfamily serine protease